LSNFWKKINILSENYPHYLKGEENCWYARDYISGGGIEGEANQLILNFKKSVDKRGSNQWHYRDQAVSQFARELAPLFGDNPFHIMAIPGSKPWAHPENNQRFQDVFKDLKRLRANLTIHWPIDCQNAVTGSSQGGTRSPVQIKSNYVWRGFISEINQILIVDDVITSGAHFRACADFLRENGFQGEVLGFFWAKTKSKDPFSDFDVVEL
jgi:hypothetical protein